MKFFDTDANSMALNIFANKADLEAAQSQIASLESDLQTAQSELQSERDANANHAQSIADLQASATTINAELESSKNKVAELESAVITAQESANLQAIDIVAQAGIAPLDVASDEVVVDHLAHIKNLSPAEKTAYVKKHKKEIQSQLTK